MNDRELTELAAKAAGCYDLGEWDDKWNCLTNYERWTFDPLTDDGDALRLAVKLCMFDYGRLKQFRLEETRLDPSRDDCTIMRRAIVRAAAEIGRTMATESVR